MSLVMPDWLDTVKGVDFSAEKSMLQLLENWAESHGWQVSDGSELSYELRSHTDIFLKDPSKDQSLRVSVLSKMKGNPGTIRIDASTYRTFELIYQPKKKKWRLETATVPLTDDLESEGWDWLLQYAFRP